MEYIEGRDLQVFSKEIKQYDLYKKLNFVMKDITKALNYIHSKGLIHRDVKPQNILITYDFIPKLVDFGLACETVECDVKVIQDKKDCCVGKPGTPVYMAPETILSRESYYSTDIWSLGATFYKVATDEYCFDFSKSKDILNVFYIIVTKTPKELKTNNQLLNNAVNSCLIPNAFERITDNELLEMLEFIF